MSRGIQVLLTFVLGGIGFFGSDGWEEEFVFPDVPLLEKEAPSANVTNGTAFESGSLKLAANQELVLPEQAVVEEYDGSTVLFFVTKSLHCLGHPPKPMPVAKAREYLGLACRNEDAACIVSSFGEWNNRGGSAQIRIFVLVPRGQAWRSEDNLSGAGSKASTASDLTNPKLEDCYWYAGIGAKEGWTTIATELHYNRFLKPN